MSENYLQNYYSNYDEDGRLEKKHQRIEFITSTKYIDQYLTEDSKILEVGAATGRYSIHYAEKGYDVTAVELVQENLDILNSKITEEMRINSYQGNALDLSMCEENEFDVTLILGPMYHMYTEEDKHTVMKEAVRVTKPDGLIYVAYITHDAVIVHWGLLGNNLTDHNMNTMFDEGFKCISQPKDVFSMFHIDEFNALAANFPLKHLHTVATDGLSPLFRERIAEINDEQYNNWVKYHLAVCERPELVGFSSHILFIGRVNK